MATAELVTDSLILLGGSATQDPLPKVEEFCKQKHPNLEYWLHCSIESEHGCRWLREHSGIDPLLVDSLLSRKVRPRLIAQHDALLLILRVADTLVAADHEELHSLRIYTDAKRIVSTSLWPLPVVDELAIRWRSRPEGKADTLFMELATRSVRGLETILDELEEQTDLLEQKVLDPDDDPDDRDVTTLALDGLHLRRCLAPQRDVFGRLAGSELSWLVSQHRKKVHEIHERVSRQLEETEVIRERTRIIREQLNSHVADEVNRRLYAFSVIAAIFLPLGFLTGLLGVNLGGIPGANSSVGFLSFCLLLVAIVTSMVAIFKRWRWL